MKTFVLKQYHLAVVLKIPDGENIDERLIPLIANIRLYLDSKDDIDKKFAHLKQTIDSALADISPSVSVETWEG